MELEVRQGMGWRLRISRVQGIATRGALVLRLDLWRMPPVFCRP